MTQEAGVDGRSSVAGALRRFWLLILAAGVIGAVLGFVLSSAQPVRYTADGRLVLSRVVPFDPLGSFANADAQRFIGNQLSIITSGPVLEAAALALSDVQVDTLRTTVTATGGTGEDVITVLATAPTAEQAKARVDAVVASYKAFRVQQVTAQTRDALAQTTDANSQSTIRVQASVYGNGLSLVEPAVLPEAPSGPLPQRDAFVLGMVFGLLTLGYALLRGDRRNAQAGIQGEAARLGVPVLAHITFPTRRLSESGSASTESLNMLLVTLDYLGEGRIRRLLLTSDVVGGSTATASALAHVAAEQGMRVLLVDGSGGAGRSAAATPPSPDLPSWAPGTVTVLHVPSPGGSSRGPGGRRLAAFLDDTAGQADLTIIDGPPIGSSAEGFSLVSAADAVLLLVRERAPVGAVSLAQERLSHTSAGLLGVVVLTDRRQGGMRWLRSRLTPNPVHEPTVSGQGTPALMAAARPLEGDPARPSVRAAAETVTAGKSQSDELRGSLPAPEWR